VSRDLRKQNDQIRQLGPLEIAGGGSLVLPALREHEVAAGELLGLAAITLALGIVYWLMREGDDRLAGASKRDPK